MNYQNTLPEFVNADVSKKQASMDSAYSCACSRDTARCDPKSVLFPTKHKTRKAERTHNYQSVSYYNIDHKMSTHTLKTVYSGL
jgi:hypothetical protein